ncbi:hypothetical protein ACMAZF_12865 [Psychrobium sp. nBUS_13]
MQLMVLLKTPSEVMSMGFFIACGSLIVAALFGRVMLCVYTLYDE